MKKACHTVLAVILSLMVLVPTAPRAEALDLSVLMSAISYLLSGLGTAQDRAEQQMILRHSFSSSIPSSSDWVEVSGDDLTETCLELNSSGIPCEVVYLSTVSGYVIRCIGEPRNMSSGALLDSGVTYSGRYFVMNPLYDYYLIYSREKHTSYYAAAMSSVLTAIRGFTDGIEGLIGTTNSRLSSVISAVDDVEGYIDQVESRMVKTVGSTTYSLADLGYNAWQQLLIMAGYLDGVEGYIDQIEGRLIKTVDNTQYTVTDVGYNAWQQLLTVAGYVDGLEGLISTSNSKLTSISGYVDGVEGQLSGLTSSVVSMQSDLSRLLSRTLKVSAAGTEYTLADLGYNTWQQLITMAGYVDGVEGYIDQVEGRMIKTVDGTQYTVTDVGYNAWQRLITLSGYVDGVEGYIDQIEGRMIKTVGDTQYTVTDVGYNAWQQLITMAGYVDGVEGTLNLIASRLLYTDANDTDWRISTLVYNAQQRLGTVNDKLDTIISNMNQHLTADVTVDIGDITLSPDDSQLTAYAKMIAYGQQDMYSTLGTIAAEYRTATSSQKTNMQSILNKYWLAPGSAQWTIQLSGDQLYDIHRRMIELGYPTRIQYDSNVPGYVIKIVGTPRVSDLLEFANDYTQSTVTVTSNYYLTLTGFLLYSSSKPTNYAIEDFATAVSSQLATINTSIQDNTSDITDALDRLYDWLDHADFTTNVTVNNVVQTYSNDVDNSITMISSILDLFRSTFNFGDIHADFFGATSYFSNLGRDAE